MNCGGYLILSFMCYLFVLTLIKAEEVDSSPKSVEATPKNTKSSEGDDVKFKSAFPYNNYMGIPYGSPQYSYYGDNSGYYNPMPYNYLDQYASTVNQPYSYYSGQPYNFLTAPQTNGIAYSQQPPYLYGIPSQGNVIYLPPGYQIDTNSMMNPDLTRVVIPANVYPTTSVHTGGDNSNKKITTSVHTPQQPSIYIPPSTGVHTGGMYPGYPYNMYNNPYDPFANVPTEIIDVDLTNNNGIPTYGGFNGNNGIYEYPVKVTSHSEHSEGTPIFKTESSVVTTKPYHATITRIFNPSKGENPTVTVVTNNDEDEKIDDEVKASEQPTANKEEDIEEEDDDEDEDEEPSNVDSWL